MDVKVTVVIVSFNGINWIEKCLSSLKTSLTSLDIIVVDNCSSDNTVAFIENTYPDVTLLKQSENLGFGKGNNIGIGLAMKKNADFVFLLNQDAYIEPNTIDELVQASTKHTDYGILSPLHLDWDGEELEYYFDRFAKRNKQFASNYPDKITNKDVYEVDFVNAAAWLIPRTVLNTVGGFDPIFRHYGEDNNYCQRVQFHRLCIGIVPGSKIYHVSKKRLEPENYLFSSAYFKNEIKDLQLKYANPLSEFTRQDRQGIRWQIFKTALRNLSRLKLNALLGYWKKYRIFEREYRIIEKSRKIVINKYPHYLDS